MISSTYSGFLCTVISIGKISPVPEVKYLWNFFNTFNWSMSSSGSSPIGILVPGGYILILSQANLRVKQEVSAGSFAVFVLVV